MNRRQSITGDTLEIAVGMRRNTTASLRHTHPAQSIAAIILVSLALLIASTIVLGARVHRGVVLPQLDAWLGGFHLKAFATNDPACADYLLCAPDHYAVSEQDYYTIWVLTRIGQPGQPGGEYEIGRRLLLMPLGH